MPHKGGQAVFGAAVAVHLTTQEREAVTGDCGGVLKCAGAGGAPPATLAEFTLDSRFL